MNDQEQINQGVAVRQVIHIIASIAPEHGGTSAVVANLTAAQVRLGLDVHVVCGDLGRWNIRAEEEFRAIEAFDQVVIHPVDIHGLEFLRCSQALNVVDTLLADGTVVHLHGVWEPLLWRISSLAVRRKVPYVLAPHSMLHPWQMKRYVLAKRLLFAVGWRSMLQAAAFIHVLNRAEADFVRQVEPSVRTCPITNGVDVARFSGPVLPLATWPWGGALEGHPYLLFLSRLHYQKGVVLLAEAFKRMVGRNPDVWLVTAGPDGGELCKIRKVLEDAGLGDHLVTPGPVYGEAKVALLRGARAFCLPSLNEGFSVAILEAMASGIPVVISENCYFREVVVAGAGLVTPLDPVGIADALEFVLENPSQAAQMGVKGRGLVESRHTWPAVAACALEYYEAALNRKIPPVGQ